MTDRRSLDAGGVTLAIILGLITGPVLFYAIAGDYWHSTGVTANHLVAGIIAAVLGLGGLFNASRFRNAGLAGAITGLAAGIGELGVAIVPWLGYDRNVTCNPGDICPQISQPDLLQIALRAGIFSTLVFVIGGYALSTLVATLRVRFQ